MKDPDIYFASQSLILLSIAKRMGSISFLILFKPVLATLLSFLLKKSNGSARRIQNRVKPSSCAVCGPDALSLNARKKVRFPVALHPLLFDSPLEIQ
jgi:hypothetical protein